MLLSLEEATPPEVSGDAWSDRNGFQALPAPARRYAARREPPQSALAEAPTASPRPAEEMGMPVRSLHSPRQLYATTGRRTRGPHRLSAAIERYRAMDDFWLPRRSRAAQVGGGKGKLRPEGPCTRA